MSKKEQKELDSFKRVTLPVVLGINPDTYVPAILATLVAILLSMFLTVPGFFSYGTQVTISSTPHGAAIYIDGVYEGQTPSRLFVPAGERTVRIEAPFHSDVMLNPEIGGRRIASIIFPKKDHLHADLQLLDPSAYARSTVREFADWALTGKEHERYRIPAVLSPVVHHLVLAGEQASAEAILQHSAGQVANPVQAKDFMDAVLLTEGPLFSTASMIAGLRKITHVAEASETGLLWIYLNAPPLLQKELEQRAYFVDQNEAVAASLITGTAPHGFGPEGLEFDPAIDPQRKEIRIQDVPFVFRVVPETSYLYGASTGSEQSGRIPYEVHIEQFYLLETAVTRQQYAAVMEEELISFDGSELLPQTGVNYSDVNQFLELLLGKINAETQDEIIVRLPTSAEWEAAARWNGDPLDDAVLWTQSRNAAAKSGNSIGNIGLSDMVGNVWEWTSSWFYRSEGYGIDPGYQAVPELLEMDQSEKIVRGASWTNRRSGVSIEQIGIQPPDWRTDYLGFRIVLEMR